MFGRFYVILVLSIASAVAVWRPCADLDALLKIPCRCNIEAAGNNSQYVFVSVDCDRTVLSLPFPNGIPIISFTQRHAGHQIFPDLSNLNAPVRRLDFSQNAIRSFPDKPFVSVAEYLTDLKLANNLLGDNLNPIFSTTAFQTLAALKVLDLSGNSIIALEESLFLGNGKLVELHLDGNKIAIIPAATLKALPQLKAISLRNNRIEAIDADTFAFPNKLERLDFRNNRIQALRAKAFSNLATTKEILLAGNQIRHIDARTFADVDALQKLDLSDNLIAGFPTEALAAVPSLKVLNISLNNIPKLEAKHMQQLKNLQILDISRNVIASILPGTFREQLLLKYLDLSLNSLRTIEDDAFEGLDNLQTLILRDNNILLIPGSALGRLPKLSNLYLDFNRVAALSSSILKSIQPENIRYLSLSRNVIRELPVDSFASFKKLIYLDISGNSLGTINEDMFKGLESTLLEIKLSYNKISSLRKIYLPKLRRLDLSSNSIDDLAVDSFHSLTNLLYLNMSNNEHISQITRTMIYPLAKLQVIDVAHCGLKMLQGDLFHNNSDLRIVLLNNNNLKVLEENTFMNLNNLFNVDLSANGLEQMKPRTFVNTVNLRTLNLRMNALKEFRLEIFTSETALESLDLSENDLNVISPNTFKIHPRMKKLMLMRNKIEVFVPDLVSGLDLLEIIDLSGNRLTTIQQLDFGRLSNLRELYLQHNAIESIQDMAFHNSTQLHIIDLSGNKLERLSERTFEGTTRIERLNLNDNKLSSLSDTTFVKAKVQKLEHIALANNRLQNVPVNALNEQHDSLLSLDLSHNMIKDIPTTNHMVMINAKLIDFSSNPLSVNAINSILGQPKTARGLNLANTGIRELPILETPYLKSLNLSHNNISSIGSKAFEKVTLLEQLDISGNKIEDADSLREIWSKLDLLDYLNLSGNPIRFITAHTFENLDGLTKLHIHHLPEITRLEKNAFKPLKGLSVLQAYGFAKLGYIDVQGVFQELPALSAIDIEIKDSLLESDQLQVINHSKLHSLGLHGYMLQSVSSGSLAGLRNKHLDIRFDNTSLSALPPALILPLPRSSHIDLSISGSKVSTLMQPFLSSLDDRKNSLMIHGLETNPIHCDCQARALRRWILSSKTKDIRCALPANLSGRLLIEVGDNELVCESKKTSTTIRTTPTISFVNYTSEVVTKSSTTEQDIIWSVAPTSKQKPKTKIPPMKQMPITNDDTLIIGIVGGVIVFIFLLIIIICICRLKMSNDTYRGPPIPIGLSSMTVNPNGMQVNYKGSKNQPMYPPMVPYAQSYATLPYKQNSSPTQARPSYSTIGRIPYQYQNQPIVPPPHQTGSMHSTHNPYIVYQDDKVYR